MSDKWREQEARKPGRLLTVAARGAEDFRASHKLLGNCRLHGAAAAAAILEGPSSVLPTVPAASRDDISDWCGAARETERKKYGRRNEEKETGMECNIASHGTMAMGGATDAEYVNRPPAAEPIGGTVEDG